MKRLITSIVAITLIIGLSGCTDSTPEQSPVRIEAKTLSSDWGGYMISVPVVEVTAVIDKVTIENVITNNGNCKMTAHRQKEFPKTLSYGQKATAGYTAKCNLVKVEVITDNGNWSVEFE
ncbi:MAG: hypothetical protein C0627_11020 [Sulfurimonas sp.]|nr:MAG: hypothetical protein C0627_11020 [Sulfurimonas sp.]